MAVLESFPTMYKCLRTIWTQNKRRVQWVDYMSGWSRRTVSSSRKFTGRTRQTAISLAMPISIMRFCALEKQVSDCRKTCGLVSNRSLRGYRLLGRTSSETMTEIRWPWTRSDTGKCWRSITSPSDHRHTPSYSSGTDLMIRLVRGWSRENARNSGLCKIPGLKPMSIFLVGILQE